MIWGTLQDGTAKIHLDADEQKQLADAYQNRESASVSKITGCNTGYYRLKVSIEPVADPTG